MKELLELITEAEGVEGTIIAEGFTGGEGAVGIADV